MKNFLFFIVLTSLSVVLINCGSGDAGLPKTSAGSIGFPSDLAISSPTTGSSSAKAKSIDQLRDPIDAAQTMDMPYDQKVEMFKSILQGSEINDCRFALSMNVFDMNAACYGPEIKFFNHPDSISTTEDGTLPIGDIGFYTANEGATTEACAAAQLNRKVKNIAGQVDSMMLTTASLFCVANVTDQSLPATGESLDLATTASDALSLINSDLTITGATIERLADTAAGDSVYVTTLNATYVDNKIIYIRLKHIPTSATNSTYKGKLSYMITTPDATHQLMWCDYGTTELVGMRDAGSISYEKNSLGMISYQLYSGQFCGDEGTIDDTFVSSTNLTVDPTKKVVTMGPVEDLNHTGWSGNFNYALFNLDPVDGSGNFQFAWQAGQGDNATRVLNAKLGSSAGVLTGPAYFAYGPDVANASLGSITEMYCNWAGPEGAAFAPDKSSKGQPLVQRQLLSKGATDTTFIATESKITYAPVLACEVSGTPAFTFGLTGVEENGAAFVHDLINVSDIGINIPVSPILPTNVDL